MLISKCTCFAFELSHQNDFSFSRICKKPFRLFHSGTLYDFYVYCSHLSSIHTFSGLIFFWFLEEISGWNQPDSFNGTDQAFNLGNSDTVIAENANPISNGNDFPTNDLRTVEPGDGICTFSTPGIQELQAAKTRP